ncbi:MAG: hypothetical protein D6806_12730 [Deltaproteobacteria bacterium]|nr:MAG: hypothetical protein D6806_12730 [Deltaproteobacteria bacterium]
MWQETLLDDRMFGPGKKLTVSSRPGATYVLDAGGTRDKKLTVAASRKHSSIVNLYPGMKGSVFVAGREQDIELILEKEGASAGCEPIKVELAEGDGCVLVFGRVGLGMWVVPAPARVRHAGFLRFVGYDRFTGKIFGFSLFATILLAFVSQLFAGTKPEMTIEQLPDRLASFMVQDREALKNFKNEMRKIEKQYDIKRKNKRIVSNRRRSSKNVGKEPVTASELRRRRIEQKVATKGLVGVIGNARRKGPLKEILGNGSLGIDLANAVRNLESGRARARVIASRGNGGSALELVPRPTTGEALGEGLDRELERRTAAGTGGRTRGRRLEGRRRARIEVSMPSSGARLSGGTLSRKEIYKVVSANKNAIRYCYESQLMRYPTLRGKVTVDFIIEPDGSVGRVRIAENRLNQARARRAVENCLARFIRRWKFPRPRGGRVRVIYPFAFGRR